jgi:hypothetical protein
MLLAASNGKELWYLTRGTGVVALLLLTASIVLGVASSARWRSARWPRFVVGGLHKNLTLLAILFVAVHVVTTVLDRFAPIGLLDAIVPFRSPYRPVWLGLGAVAFDLLLALVVTSLLRARIGIPAWRAVHWLAYASWPVALLHTLGTGSDAKTGWLQLLSAGCTLVVAGAVVWRGWVARTTVPVRLAAAGSALVSALALAVWAQTGPLRRGWAARAGTPTHLLASATAVSATTATGSQPALPSGSFSAPLQGRIVNRQEDSGLVVVTIDATASGAFNGRVHVALRGQPLAGGGVQMLAAVVGLLPDGATAWDSGTVTGLNGQQIITSVQGPSGETQRYLLDLRIDAAQGSVAGTIGSVSG